MHGDSDKADEAAPPAGASPAEESAVESGETASQRSSSQPPPDPLATAQAEAARLKEAWMRTAADFDNFRKRTRREVEEAKRNGREDLLRVLLPVFDNLGRAIQSAARSTDLKAMADGLSMVQRQFVEALAREGITKVPTVGKAFDPGMHEAIQQVETDEHPAGTVIAEIQPGYMQGERLMRAAMVVVARAKAEGAESGEGSVEPAN